MITSTLAAALLAAPLVAGCDSGNTSTSSSASTDSSPTSDPSTSAGTTGDPATSDPSTTDPSTDPSTTDPSTTDPATTDPATTDATTGGALCGNGVVDEGETCDDGNDLNHDECTVLCEPPSCDDGIMSGAETDVDCGTNQCGVCVHGQSCNNETQCEAECIMGTCYTPTSCKEAADKGLYGEIIDPDGPDGPIEPYPVICSQDDFGGEGYTMVLVAADDEVDTWTWNNRALLTTDTTTVGSIPTSHDHDFKSRALHDIPFTDIMFVHIPSGVWAAYHDVGDGTTDLGTFMAGLPQIQCDETQGYPMTEGTLTSDGNELCSTDLFFHAGDREGGNIASCLDPNAPFRAQTYGPSWSRTGNAPCPLDDPSNASLGFADEVSNHDVESFAVGYGYAIGENNPDPGTGETFQVWIR